jgi:hypothetical protein
LGTVVLISEAETTVNVAAFPLKATQELATPRPESGRSGYFAVIAARQVSLGTLWQPP